jgi:hypothetical protein
MKKASLTERVGASEIEKTQQIRLVVLVPMPLYRNLELYCLKDGVKKQAVVIRVLSEFLEGTGMKPELLPRIDYTYDPG